MTTKEYLSPENKKAKETAERIYDKLFPEPTTHKDVIDRINLVQVIKEEIYGIL